MQFSLLEAQGPIWEGQAKEVILPTEEGEMSVLDFHQPFSIKLVKGLLKSASQKIQIQEGLAVMKSNKLNVFVERAG